MAFLTSHRFPSSHKIEIESKWLADGLIHIRLALNCSQVLSAVLAKKVQRIDCWPAAPVARQIPSRRLPYGPLRERHLNSRIPFRVAKSRIYETTTHSSSRYSNFDSESPRWARSAATPTSRTSYLDRGATTVRPAQACFHCLNAHADFLPGERDFEDLKLLISHQKAKHFKCDRCGRRLNTAGGWLSLRRRLQTVAS